MNLMGVGPMELFVVLLVAFLVLGPERMVTSARDVAKVVTELRQTFSSIPRTLDDLLEEPEPSGEDARKESPGVARPRRRRGADGDDTGAEA